MRSEMLLFGKPNFSEQEIAAVTRVLKSGWVGMGPETIKFEEELRAFLHAKNVVTVNSCTSALYLSLLVSGIKKGDEVIVPSFTWCSTVNVVEYLGAKVVFCDIEPDTYNISPATVHAKLTRNTKAVIPVHMGGLAVDIRKLRSELPEHVRIIEDAAHALGSRYNNGMPVGSSGNLTCFSFYANKNLSTAEGGAIAVPDKKIAERLRSLRLHGLSSNAWKRFKDSTIKSFTPVMMELGYKMNYTDLQAAIGRVQLARQAEFRKIRMEIAKYYIERLCKLNIQIPAQSGILEPYHSRHLFLIELPVEKIGKSRDEVVAGMRGQNIGASVHYKPVHQMPYYSKKGKCYLQITDRIAERVMTLPIGTDMNLLDAKETMDVFEQIVFGKEREG
jgi:perosamine synthetase